jgi:hypothetical protein
MKFLILSRPSRGLDTERPLTDLVSGLGQDACYVVSFISMPVSFVQSCISKYIRKTQHRYNVSLQPI